LWFNELPPYDKYNTQFFFWNTAFAWQPDLVQSEGGVWVGDIGSAPVIELDRTDVQNFFSATNRGRFAGSRLYWAKYFCASTLAYDVDKFDKWFTSVIRWVRKNGLRATEVTGAPYLLPDVWERWEELRAEK
jgi:hypothetical protein